MNPHNRLKHRVLAIAALTAVAISTLPAASAAIYKWVDDQGETHYSQQPPANGQAQRIDTRRPDPQAVQRARERVEQQEQRLDKQRRQRQKAARDEKETAKIQARRKRGCEQAQANLKQLTHNRRLLTTNDAGKTVRMTEDQRQAKVKQMRKRTDKYCDR